MLENVTLLNFSRKTNLKQNSIQKNNTAPTNSTPQNRFSFEASNALKSQMISFKGIDNSREKINTYLENSDHFMHPDIDVFTDRDREKYIKDRKIRQEAIEVFFQDLASEPVEFQKSFLKAKRGTKTYDMRTFVEESFDENNADVASTLINYLTNADSEVKKAAIKAYTIFQGNIIVNCLDNGWDDLAEKFLKDVVSACDDKTQATICQNEVIDYLEKKNQLDFASKLIELQNALKARGIDFKRRVTVAQQISKSDLENLKSQKDDDEKENSKYEVRYNIKTTLADFAGYPRVKEKVKKEFLNLINNPKIKKSDLPSGILLYGPAGTGKTLLATAIAGEAKIPMLSTNGSSFVELYVGAGPKEVRKLYKEAREVASNHPSKIAIVFIDEIDAVAAKRTNEQNSEANTTLNALLSEMDGIKNKENSDIKVITIMTTNRKDLLDSAILRPGRTDLEIQIDDTGHNVKSRREILEVHAKNKPFKNEETKNKILDELAQTTGGFSGAQLAEVMKKAYRATMEKPENEAFITEEDLLDAKLDIMAGVVFDAEVSDEEFELAMTHEIGHGVNQLVMNDVFKNETSVTKKPVRDIDAIINQPRGQNYNSVLLKPSSQNHRYSVESLLADLVVTYGGYSSEEVLYQGHCEAVSGDLEMNTKKILEAIQKYGFGKKVKYLSTASLSQGTYIYSAETKADVEMYTTYAMQISKRICEFLEDFIREYSHTQTQRAKEGIKYISGDEFKKDFATWLEKNDKVQEYEIFCQNLRKVFADFNRKQQGIDKDLLGF